MGRDTQEFKAKPYQQIKRPRHATGVTRKTNHTLSGFLVYICTPVENPVSSQRQHGPYESPEILE